MCPEIRNRSYKLLFRDAKDQSKYFSGTNTDGEGSLDPILVTERTKRFNYLFVRLWSVGKAIAAFLIKNMKVYKNLKYLTELKLKIFIRP